MKKHRSILSFALAILVVFSSSNFMVGLHICSGQIQNIALFSKAEGCEMEKRMPPCHRKESKPCCEDETIVHDAQDFKSNGVQVNIAVPEYIDIIQPTVLLAEVIPSSPVSLTEYYNYDPPLRSCDLTVAHQIFLI